MKKDKQDEKMMKNEDDGHTHAFAQRYYNSIVLVITSFDNNNHILDSMF